MAKADAKGVPPAKYALSYDCYQFIITYPFDLLTFNVLLFFKKSSIGQKILYCKKRKNTKASMKKFDASHTFLRTLAHFYETSLKP